MSQMMNKALIRERHTHQHQIGMVASGFIGAGGTARFRWDGEHWTPEGRTDAALFLGVMSDAELRSRLCPDIATVLALGPHWADAAAARYTHDLEDD